MQLINRRRFLALAGAALCFGPTGIAQATNSRSAAPRILVVGGGYGGATAARYLRWYDPGLQVTLLEKNSRYISCPLSNEVLAGDRTLEQLTFGYQGLADLGVRVIIDTMTGADFSRKQVTTDSGGKLDYDFLVLSPGIDFRWDAIKGYDRRAAESIPHAWQAGPQTLLLRRQLTAMADGGEVLIVAPPNPFRCPPGPYERAAQIAHYLKAHKPKSKVLILDPKRNFSKQAAFQEGWQRNYGEMIRWLGADDGGLVTRIDPDSRRVISEAGTFRPAVLNVIPPMQAAALARRLELTDESGWCPVNQRNFESTLVPDLFIIGDSCQAGEMPKSGYSANSQGKVVAAAIAARVAGRPEPQPSFINTCYSLLAPDDAISIATVYRYRDGWLSGVPDSGGVSAPVRPDWERRREARYQQAWFHNITSDIW